DEHIAIDAAHLDGCPVWLADWVAQGEHPIVEVARAVAALIVDGALGVEVIPEHLWDVVAALFDIGCDPGFGANRAAVDANLPGTVNGLTGVLAYTVLGALGDCAGEAGVAWCICIVWIASDWAIGG